MQSFKYFFLLAIVFCTNALAANDTVIAPIAHANLKKGIFKTFKEFTNNQPSILDSFEIEAQLQTDYFEDKTSNTILLGFLFKYPATKQSVKRIYGGYDGKNLYIDFDQHDIVQIKRRYFLPVTYIGRFAFIEYKRYDDEFYELIPADSIETKFLSHRSNFSWPYIRKDKIILFYINHSGKIVEANQWTFTSLLKHDKDLLEAYKSEKIVTIHTFKKYLYKMNERYPF